MPDVGSQTRLDSYHHLHYPGLQIPPKPRHPTTTTTTHLILGLLADQPEEENIITSGIHFREGVQVTLQGGGPLGLRWGLPHG